MNDAEIEDSDRATGTVVEFDARRGFGFLKPEDEEDKTKQVFCHWKDIETEDRWPKLNANMIVEYTPVKEKGKVKATKITLVGGEKISVGEDSEKNYNMDTKYKGKVKFYDGTKGFGFIVPILENDETLEWEGETADKEKGLYVAREEILAEGDGVGLDDGMMVEFNVYHGPKGLGAGHVCAVGGGKIKFKGRKRGRDSRGWGGRGRGRGGWGGTKRMRMGGWGRGRGGPPLDPDKIEVGLYIPNNYIGKLIGKGGETVKQIRKDSGGANVQFADASQRGFSRLQVVSLSGDEDQVSNACCEIIKKMEELSDGKNPGLTFLIPRSYCGMFIGAKGSNIKEIEKGSGVDINVSKVPIQLAGGSVVSLAELKGESEEIEVACAKVVPILGTIAKKVIQDQMGWGGGGW